LVIESGYTDQLTGYQYDGLLVSLTLS